MTVSYKGDTRISVSQEDKECCYLDPFLKGKSLWPKIIVLKEEEEKEKPFWTRSCPHCKNQTNVTNRATLSRSVTSSPTRDRLHLACFPYLLSSCPCKQSDLQTINIWVYNLGFIDLTFPQQEKATSLTV